MIYESAFFYRYVLQMMIALSKDFCCSKETLLRVMMMRMMIMIYHLKCRLVPNACICCWMLCSTNPHWVIVILVKSRKNLHKFQTFSLNVKKSNFKIGFLKFSILKQFISTIFCTSLNYQTWFSNI